MNTNLIEYRPPRIAMALVVLAAVIHVSLPSQSTRPLSLTYLAGALVSAGFVLMMLAWWQFKERKIAICPTEPTEGLITDGIYRFTRNPMYLGMVLMLGGVAVFFGTLPFYVATGVYFFLINRWFCRYEEEKLLAAFGEDYEHYRSNVRRWI